MVILNCVLGLWNLVCAQLFVPHVQKWPRLYLYLRCLTRAGVSVSFTKI